MGEKEVRDRKKPLKVYVSDTERKRIEQLSQRVKMTPTAYLREVGLGFQPKSAFDQEAIRELVKLHADQGRLGGLLKLWLTERKGEGAQVKEVRSVLQQIESLQIEIARWVMNKKAPE
jgi:hypothetical protein